MRPLLLNKQNTILWTVIERHGITPVTVVYALFSFDAMHELLVVNRIHPQWVWGTRLEVTQNVTRAPRLRERKLLGNGTCSSYDVLQVYDNRFVSLFLTIQAVLHISAGGP